MNKATLSCCFCGGRLMAMSETGVGMLRRFVELSPPTLDDIESKRPIAENYRRSVI